MATPEETRAGDGEGAEALGSMSEGDAAPISRPENQARATTSTDSADAASAAAGEKTAAAPSDASETLEAVAALRVADDAGDVSEDAPVAPRAPDVFDRLGYGDSAEVSGGNGPGLGAGDPSGKSDGRSRTRDDHDESDDDEYDDETHPTDDAATLFLDSVVAVADGEIPMDATALGSMANALAREVGVVAEDDNLTLLADAPIAVRVAVRRVSDLALALTLAPPDLARRARGRARAPARGRVLPDRHAGNRCRARGVRHRRAREAVARCPSARAPRGRAGGGGGGTGRGRRKRRFQWTSASHRVLPDPVTAAAAMLFAYEQSTPLQCAAARVLCAALTAAEAPAGRLCSAAGGARRRRERVVPNPADAEEAEMQRLSLHARLAAVAEAAVRVRPGARRCGAGMAMIVAETLRDARAEAAAFEASRETSVGQTEQIATPVNDDSANDSANDCLWSKAKLISALESDERWRAACDDDDGAFARFERDVRGGLCGPKPSRVASVGNFASGVMGSPGGGPFGGGDLMQVLQKLGGVGITAPASPAQ